MKQRPQNIRPVSDVSVVEWLVCLLRNWELPGSFLSQKPGHPAQGVLVTFLSPPTDK